LHAEPSNAEGKVYVERAIARQALDAQVKLLPYALAFFAIALPIFLRVSAFAPNALWLALCLGVYAFNWAAFYAIYDWIKRKPEAADNVRLRTRVQLFGALLWALAIVQTSWFALGAGALSDTLLVLCAGAAVAVIFFSSPSLPSLLLVGPIAAAGPVLALKSNPATDYVGNLVLAGSALALALSLILNRHLREHFALAVERERLIGEREAALEQARKLAKSKSDLVSTLSHEIRNGLSGVAHVLAGALGAGSRGAPSREQLKAGLNAARDLVDVLDATLDSETAEAGRLVVSPRPLDGPALVHDLVLLHKPTASAKALDLVARIDEALSGGRGAVIGDSARVRQILNNLVGNAVKYTTRGVVELRLRKLDARTVRFEVVDTGPGLSSDELAQAFQPFTRVVRTGAGVPGAGLGLSLSRRLATLMGGEVAAESAPGVGSRFWLDLPFDHAADAPAAQPAPEPSRILKVLIAEDDQLNAAMLRAVLEQLGHKVLHAQDGARALELLRVSEIDLVMMDGRMPVMDGVETTRALRALEGAAGRVPVVAVIGGDAEEAQALTEAGADAVIRKPVTVAGVARAVADVTAPKTRDLGVRQVA